MKSILKLLALLLVCGAPAAQAVTIRFAPPTQSGTLGGTVTVEAVIEDFAPGEELGGYDLSVTWNQSILGLSSFSLGGGLDVNHLGSFSVTDSSTAGLFNAFEVSLDSEADLDALQPGSFTLFTLNFIALGEGSTSLNFLLNSITDAAGNALVVDAMPPGSVTVSAVPLPAAAWLLLSGAGMALGITRRQRRRQTG